ncbi:MAG: hypothetical protein GTO22_27665 [Gemmatimonadales bacterium]|nr:hypothetical protein [Gemmatimonadales bacterium]
MTEPTGSFQVRAVAGRKGVWTLSLPEDALKLEASDGSESHEVSRADAPERIDLLEPLIGQPLLRVKLPKTAVFAFDTGGPPGSGESAQRVEEVRQWLGPLTARHLSVALRRRLPWVFPIGAIFLLSSIPLPGDPAAGVEPLPFDSWAALLGAILIAIGFFERVAPRKELFLLDASWFLLAAGKIAIDIAGGDSWLWGILIVIMLFAAVSGIREFQRFRHVTP